MMSRSLVELCINATYILGSESTVAQDSLDHAEFMIVDDLSRESNVNGYTILAKSRLLPSDDYNQRWEELQKRFRRKNGNVRPWTDLSIDQRIAAISTHLGKDIAKDLQFARFSIYRHASEVLHGTFFSIVYTLGAAIPGKADRRTSELQMLSIHNMSLLAVNMSFFGLVGAMIKTLPYPELTNRTTEILSLLKTIEDYSDEFAHPQGNFGYDARIEER